MSKYPLPKERLETKLGDKNPLYTHAEAVTEANRCIYCVDAPCIQACPTGIDIPTFIHKIAGDNVKGSARTILDSNLLGTSCARVCPVEVLCAGDCVYNHWDRPPIEIGRLQRYATETALKATPDLISRTKKPSTGKKVALIGAGPASLAAAGHLALEGHKAVIFEQKKIPGGLNTLGIAPYKLKAEDALEEIEFIKGLGDVEIKTGMAVAEEGGGITPAQLLADYDAVFVGIGLGPDNFLRIEAEEGAGVVGATELIERIKSDPSLSLDAVNHMVIVGAGNTAIDIAREAALLGVNQVSMVYRKDAAAMSGYVHEMVGARKEGVRLLEYRQPTKVVRDDEGSVTGIELAVMVDGKASGQTEIVDCDLIALAIGQSRLTDLAKSFKGVSLDDRGRVQVDAATCQTGNPKVYAGGDCVNGGMEVVNAAQHGKLAAKHMSSVL